MNVDSIKETMEFKRKGDSVRTHHCANIIIVSGSISIGLRS